MKAAPGDGSKHDSVQSLFRFIQRSDGGSKVLTEAAVVQGPLTKSNVNDM